MRQRGAEIGRRVKRAEDVDRADGRECQFRRDVGGQSCKSHDPGMQHLARVERGFEVAAEDIAQAQVERAPFDEPSDLVRVDAELRPDRRPDEVGPAGVEPFLDQKVDTSEVDIAEVDRDLLGVGLLDLSRHERFPSTWMVSKVSVRVTQA